MAAVPDGMDLSAGQGFSPRSHTPPPSPPPPLPLKDDIRTPGTAVDVYFNSPRVSRAGSVYSLSRASFAAQLSQLTSLGLPDPSSLSSTVAAIPTAAAAARALGNAAEQIQQWIQKAEEVLGGLDAEDDVEWAAAGGRDGVEEVEGAIVKFRVLVNVYVVAIEHLQKRPDADDMPKSEMKRVLDTLDQVVNAWANVGELLAEVKRQVELALEFEELWNGVLGAIGQEIEALDLLIFEMEENRHHGNIAEEHAADSGADALDIQELQTIVEETPATVATGGSSSNSGSPMARPGNRLSLLPSFNAAASSGQSPGPIGRQTDSRLMELFARMQPLRASLDFLPIKLESYRNRAQRVVPTACDELDQRRSGLEAKYTGLQEDADRLRQELAEDNWLAAFRNADRQVRKICKSLEYGIAKLQEALESGNVTPNNAVLQKKISDYEAKKNHYAPNLQRVIQIIDSGVRDRRTINGEVLQIQNDAREMWETLTSQMEQIDAALEDLSAHRSQQLRESVSSILSTDLSANESTVDTPGSSPASSVYQGHGHQDAPATPEAARGARTSTTRSASGSRASTLTAKPRASLTAHPAGKRVSSNPIARLTSASPSPGTRPSPSNQTQRRSGAPVPIKERPRWNGSPVIDYKKNSGYFKPLSMQDANPHARSLNGKPLNAKPSVYQFRSSPASTLAKSSPLAQDKGPSTPSATRANGIRTAPSSATRPSSYPTPVIASRVTTATPKSTGRGDPVDVHPHVRSYKPYTPNPTHIPAISHPGSSGKKLSHLPLPTNTSGTVKFDDSIGDGETSPTFRATLARRPATSMETGRRSSSLLPNSREMP